MDFVSYFCPEYIFVGAKHNTSTGMGWIINLDEVGVGGMATHGNKSFQCCQIQRLKEKLSRIPMGFSQTSTSWWFQVGVKIKNI